MQHNWIYCFGVLVAQSLLLSPTLTSAEPPLRDIERQFRDMPMEARRWTGPLFWLHGDESKERLEMYVEKVAEGGNGCFTAESRPHSDWMGPGWWRDLKICLDAAKKHDLKLWIFDEKWWPSGEVGGKVPARYGSKKMTVTATNIQGPAHVSIAAFRSTNFIAVVAGQESPAGLAGETLVDLSSYIRDGALNWDAPAGNWKIMRFSWTPRKSGSRYLVDGASPDCAEWYVQTVYQPHYDHFKDDFGKNIVGFFYDEPETHGDWGTDVLNVLAERRVDWKRALVAWKFKLAGEEQAAARYQYHDALAEAWGRTLYGGITKWCREHKVQSIGHFLEHGNVYLNQDLCAGNMFQLMKYSDMGAIDAVFSQFAWGRRVAGDPPCWQTPKLGSSITHAYGKPDDVTMVEIFGARGQDLTYPEMKWWTDHMQVSGVNFLIPHSFNPRAPHDTDCPPYFYNGGFEPRWPLYRVFADYTSRLSLMLSGGRHVCPVALLFLGHSAHVGKRILPDQLSEALQDALYDCDWIPYEVLEKDMQISGKELRLRNESFKVLILPGAEVLPYNTLAKAKQFFDAGGVVIGYGILPAKSATLGKTSAEIAALREEIWGNPQPGLTACKANANGGRSYFLPEKPSPVQLQQVLAGDARVPATLEVIEGRSDNWLHVLHRVKAGRDIFFVANQKHTGPAREFKFRIRAEGFPECWDAMHNEITSVPFTRNGGAVDLALTMQPNESVLLVFQEAQRALPSRSVPATTLANLPIIQQPATVNMKTAAKTQADHALAGCSWVWFPEGNPAQAAPPGARYFRKSITVPADRKLAKAVFSGTADNSFAFFINSKQAGRSDESPEGWRRPVELNVRDRLQTGKNQLALEAINATDKSSPAGLIGSLRLEFESGEPLIVKVDKTWKTSSTRQTGWAEPAFDDSTWSAAREVATFGAGPWGILGGGMTLSPVQANPFFGKVEMPLPIDMQKICAYLEMDDVSPELATRVTINGQYAGGMIGKPLRLEVTRFLKPGVNSIQLEPFAPKSARVTVYNAP